MLMRIVKGTAIGVGLLVAVMLWATACAYFIGGVMGATP